MTIAFLYHNYGYYSMYELDLPIFLTDNLLNVLNVVMLALVVY